MSSKTSKISIDEIARIFSKSHSLYIGGEIGIFPSPQDIFSKGHFPECDVIRGVGERRDMNHVNVEDRKHRSHPSGIQQYRVGYRKTLEK